MGIARNTTIPVKKSEIFSTAVDNQTNVEIHILQGERELVSGNKSLGNFRLDNIPKAGRGIPQIDVTFDIDVDGLLSVKAKETEIESMLADAEKYASVDQKKRQDIDLKNEAEIACLETEKELSKLGNQISEDQVTNINNLIENIRTAIKNENF